METLFNEDDYDSSLDEIQAQFITDGVMCALKRWILTHYDMTADDFIEKLRTLVSRLLKAIHKKYGVDE